MFKGSQKNGGWLTDGHVMDIIHGHVHFVATLNMLMIYNFAFWMNILIILPSHSGINHLSM